MTSPARPAAPADCFADRHIGPSDGDAAKMLASLGLASFDELLDQTIPAAIRSTGALALPPALSEVEAIARLRAIAGRNVVRRSMIGQGFSGTVTPPVILRNVLENPAWYTAYTPYQPEISQGRLEALLNFQTMVADLTAMDLASASLLDEATAAAEAVTLARRQSRSKSNRFLIDADCHPQVIDVVRTRAEPLGWEIVVCAAADAADAVGAEGGVFGALLASPGSSGAIVDHRPTVDAVHASGGLVAVASDLLACVLLAPPGEWGADIVIGSAQRFGVPLGFGGPHAGFMAIRDAHKRALPGRLVGVSVDAQGRTAMRLALQTREQHIRREKATSNICTAQVLLAVMSGMYACWHGPDGLRRIATGVHERTSRLAAAVRSAVDLTLMNDTWFDTLTIGVPGAADAVVAAAEVEGVNIRRVSASLVGISCDETTTDADIDVVVRALGISSAGFDATTGIPESMRRTGEILVHPVFRRHHSETEMLRYLRRLADKDLALDRTMIPLGSCTMKLNATTEMIPVTWPEFSDMHPFAPAAQTAGYRELIAELEAMLVEVTGYDAVSLQPNAGSQGEFAGLLAIRAYHRSRGETGRTVCLIPSSAHGTNAASAVMAGMEVVVVGCDDAGNVDVTDLQEKIRAHRDSLSALMITYPSTHGVFEEQIIEICSLVHEAGGQVYLDGANFNALVGVAKPGQFGADVSHLNLHKTFCIPHGGGGPGVGPVCVRRHLAPFLPGHLALDGTSSVASPTGSVNGSVVGALTSAPYGSAGILPIPWGYIAMMGPDGLRSATAHAILGANYIAQRLGVHYPILYTGARGRVAHECILDLRPITAATGVSVDDVAKRLIDYGFHAPTMSFPVPGTLMVEPTESEGLEELDRFCEAMIAIRGEIDRVAAGEWPADDNPLRNAPHPAEEIANDGWSHPYGRELAAYPLRSLRANKYWAPVSRIDGAYGDRNVVCSCPPLEEYA